MSPRLKFIGHCAVFIFFLAFAVVAVFASLQVLAPSLGNIRAYVENDLPTLLVTIAALVGITYVFKNI